MQGGRISYGTGYAGAALALEAWAWQLNNLLENPIPKYVHHTTPKTRLVFKEHLILHCTYDLAIPQALPRLC